MLQKAEVRKRSSYPSLLSQAHPDWQRCTSAMISLYSLWKGPGHALMNAELYMHSDIYNFNTLINLCVAQLLFIMSFLVHRTGNCTESWKTPSCEYSDVSARLASKLKLCCWTKPGIQFLMEKKTSSNPSLSWDFSENQELRIYRLDPAMVIKAWFLLVVPSPKFRL